MNQEKGDRSKTAHYDTFNNFVFIFNQNKFEALKKIFFWTVCVFFLTKTCGHVCPTELIMDSNRISVVGVLFLL